MSTSRLEAFSDGVFAVAITLLVLQFTVPTVVSGHLLPALLGQWPQLVTFVASFLTVGVVWVNHHAIFRGLRAIDRTIQFINLVLLLAVVLVPYPTELLGHYLNSGADGSVAAAFYAVVMTVMSISFQVLVAWALTHPHLLRPEVRARSLRAVMPRFGLGLVTYAVSIALAFVSADLVVAIYAVTAVYYAFNQLPWLGEDVSAQR
jgi:TMEM175 potassium channel family protein